MFTYYYTIASRTLLSHKNVINKTSDNPVLQIYKIIITRLPSSSNYSTVYLTMSGDSNFLKKT